MGWIDDEQLVQRARTLVKSDMVPTAGVVERN